MSSTVQIALVALMAGVACSLAGVFLVLRKMAMVADAISHSVLPGLVAAYFIARGPHLGFGIVGAAAAGLLTVFLIEALTKTKQVKEDSAIGLVFPFLFALGVFVISKYMSNIHIDTDAILYGEIAFAPFDTWTFYGHDLGPQSGWILGILALVNAIFLKVFFKELKLTTFDAGLAASLGFSPVLIHYSLMSIVSLTTVGAFNAVGAILAVALIIVPPICARLLTEKLTHLVGISAFVGSFSSLVGFFVAQWLDVSISGMIATTLGGVFTLLFMLSPKNGILAQIIQQKQQRVRFSVEMLLMHISSHQHTDQANVECTILHLEHELAWTGNKAAEIVKRAENLGYVVQTDGSISLTPQGLAYLGRLS